MGKGRVGQILVQIIGLQAVNHTYSEGAEVVYGREVDMSQLLQIFACEDIA